MSAFPITRLRRLRKNSGWIDEKRIVMEVLTGIKRAGADIIISYFAPQVAQWLQK